MLQELQEFREQAADQPKQAVDQREAVQPVQLLEHFRETRSCFAIRRREAAGEDLGEVGEALQVAPAEQAVQAVDQPGLKEEDAGSLDNHRRIQ